MKETYGVFDKYFKALLALVVTLSLIVALLVVTRFVSACGGGSSGCASGSHAGHQTASDAGHEGHTEHSAAASYNQQSQGIRIQQIKALMNTPIFINDPAALLAQADILGLSEDQKAKLHTIQKEAADKALAILTDRQRQQLGDVTESITPAQICNSVCPHKQDMAADRQVHKEQTVCPVMAGRAVNKDIFTEYKGKKVYFCCLSCKGEFEKNPEKYISKLPQFKQ